MLTPWGGTRGRRVAGVGPRRAPVLLVGEAPGNEEDRDGQPFVGPSGQFLFTGKTAWGSDDNRWRRQGGLEGLGLPRSDLRIENVIELRPPENQVWRLSPARVERWQADFWRRLEKLEPTVIVPVGNLALNTLRRAPLPLTKKGKWRMRRAEGQVSIDWRDKIHNWRGSIFNATTNNGRKVKVIPTYHPSYFLHGGGAFFDVWEVDWRRIVGDKEFRELRHDPRSEHLVNPTPTDVSDFYQDVVLAWQRDPKHAILAADIEVVAKGKIIDCVGLSIDERFSLTLDLKHRWAWRSLRLLMAHPIAKGWHYGLFDMFKLWQHAIPVVNARWDSQQQHHCLDPFDTHKLAYCASRDLRVSFWKDEGKEEGKSAGVAMTRNRPKLHRYCGKDVTRTHALIVRYRERLRERGLLGIYRDHYRRLSAACFRLAQTGFLVDERARRRIEHREVALLATIRSEMTKLAGTDLVAKNGLSSPKVASYFYDTLKCKPFYRRGTGNRTADELAIRRLMHKYKKARPGGIAILGYRQHAKIKQEVRASLVSQDGRLRSRYSPTTDTGRLRAMKVSQDEGINAQNRDRHSDLRRMFVADRGCVLVEGDQSQGESRIVDGMSGTREGLRMARILPTLYDGHCGNACKIFDDVEYEELLAAYKAGDPDAVMKRDLGKRTRHATNYDMGPDMMAETALVETEGRLVLDRDECKEWLERMHAATPGVALYQSWIRRELIEQGTLTSSWGRSVTFTGLRLTKEDHKRAYAWRAQHEVGVLTNQCGFVPLDEKLAHGNWLGTRIVQQGHDSLVASVPYRWAWDVATMLAASMGEERSYPGAGGEWTLAMPIGIKVGYNWAGRGNDNPTGMREWKLLPTKEDFDQWVQRLAA